MALKIFAESCDNCGACEVECPMQAIYAGGAQWKLSDGTNAKGIVTLPGGLTIDAAEAQPPLDMNTFYIVPGKCNECVGFHDEPQCAAVCPLEACIDDPDFPLGSAMRLHPTSSFPHKFKWKTWLLKWKQ